MWLRSERKEGRRLRKVYKIRSTHKSVSKGKPNKFSLGPALSLARPFHHTNPLPCPLLRHCSNRKSRSHVPTGEHRPLPRRAVEKQLWRENLCRQRPRPKSAAAPPKLHGVPVLPCRLRLLVHRNKNQMSSSSATVPRSVSRGRGRTLGSQLNWTAPPPPWPRQLLLLQLHRRHSLKRRVRRIRRFG